MKRILSQLVRELPFWIQSQAVTVFAREIPRLSFFVSSYTPFGRCLGRNKFQFRLETGGKMPDLGRIEKFFTTMFQNLNLNFQQTSFAVETPSQFANVPRPLLRAPFWITLRSQETIPTLAAHSQPSIRSSYPETNPTPPWRKSLSDLCSFGQEPFNPIPCRQHPRALGIPVALNICFWFGVSHVRTVGARVPARSCFVVPAVDPTPAFRAPPVRRTPRTGGLTGCCMSGRPPLHSTARAGHSWQFTGWCSFERF